MAIYKGKELIAGGSNFSASGSGGGGGGIQTCNFSVDAVSNVVDQQLDNHLDSYKSQIADIVANALAQYNVGGGRIDTTKTDGFMQFSQDNFIKTSSHGYRYMSVDLTYDSTVFMNAAIIDPGQLKCNTMTLQAGTRKQSSGSSYPDIDKKMSVIRCRYDFGSFSYYYEYCAYSSQTDRFNVKAGASLIFKYELDDYGSALPFISIAISPLS